MSLIKKGIYRHPDHGDIPLVSHPVLFNRAVAYWKGQAIFETDQICHKCKQDILSDPKGVKPCPVCGLPTQPIKKKGKKKEDTEEV